MYDLSPLLQWTSQGLHLSLFPGEGGPGCDEKRNPMNLCFCKNGVSKRYKNNEKVGQMDKNLGQNLYKLLQNCQMTGFGEELDQN